MNDDRLGNLLRQIDQQSIPALPPDLASQVRHIARRQRQFRITASAAATLALAAIPLWFALHRTPHHPTPSNGNEHQLLAQLDREAALHMQLAEYMIEAESRSRRPQPAALSAPPADALALIQRERERAAFIIVDQADRHLLKHDRTADAAREYREALNLFPNTRGAQLARQRLQQLQPGKEG